MTENQTTQNIDIELLDVLRRLLDTVDSDPNASDTDIMQAIDWATIRNAVARAQSQFQYKATITLSESEGNCIVLGFQDGREIRFEIQSWSPEKINLGFYDGKGIDELGWTANDLNSDPVGVLNAFFEKLCDVLRYTGTAMRQEEK